MQYFIYILTNWNDEVMYVGVTNDLRRRLYEHQNDLADGFTKRYRVHKPVWFEVTGDVETAIAREKQIKGWTIEKKNALVEEKNPEWADLSPLINE